VYAGVIAIKERLLERGWLRQRRLGHPVISIGSLSAGGAGKTPVVVMLAELLGNRGFEVRILTRGYGRSGRAVERVHTADGDARRFGDEPVMMARRLSGPKAHAAIWVGADRFQAGTLSETEDAPGQKVVYLLDDGFQHRKLVRDIDVVLLTRQDLTDSLLPVGNLREPLNAMRRADVVVLREDEGFAGAISGKAATWFVQRELRFAEGSARPKRTVAFCGLARPEGFFPMVEKAGVEVAAVSVFRDHHAYSAGDIEGLIDLAKLHGADGFVTTEKDAVKLSDGMRERLQAVGVLLIPELWVGLRDEAARLEGLIRLIEAKMPGPDDR
jgi:tetraacyldisaccharide 4'-kinase